MWHRPRRATSNRRGGDLGKRNERESRSHNRLARIKRWIAVSPVARLSWRSLWIPKPARTAQVPVPVGSQDKPTRGCSNNLAWFSVRQDLPLRGSVEITKFL